MMRNVIGIMFAIITCMVAVTVANESFSQRHYTDIDTVKSWIEPPAGILMREWMPEGASFIEANIARSGDWVGRTIARAYEKEELLDPDRLGRVLSLIRLSFSDPKIIVPIEDKNPRVTMLLLFFLKQECKDIKLHQKIIDAEIYITEQLAKSDKRTE